MLTSTNKKFRCWKSAADGSQLLIRCVFWLNDTLEQK